jgi:cyclase
MFRPRIIPVLLLKNHGLVKSKAFKDFRYIGDPINAVKIYNDLKADELVFLDITATAEKRLISLALIKNIGEEANMPFAVGGGITKIEDIRSIINAGAEKVIINSYAAKNPDFIKQASETFGSSTIVVCIDVKKTFLFGKEQTFIFNGKHSTGYSPEEFACLMEEKGAGEIIIQSITNDGMMQGYNLDLIRRISSKVTIPVVALGGAGNLDHLKEAYLQGHANGLAAGSLFIYQGAKHGVLINYPEKTALKFNNDF